MKKIVYLSSLYDFETYRKFCEDNIIPIQAANKYHRLLCDGLKKNGADVKTMCILPIPHHSIKRLIFPKHITHNSIRYNYVGTINLSFLKHILFFLNSFFSILFSSRKCILLFDGLIISASYGAVLAAKIRRIKSVAILTDLPDYMDVARKNTGLRINNKLLKKADGFVFLTEEMNHRINTKNKPHIVVEGQVDSAFQYDYKPSKETNIKKIVYAGSIEKGYGLDMLCKAFDNIHCNDEELHIYGGGAFNSELMNLFRDTKCIYFHGLVSPEEVLQAELDAMVLINPRPDNDNFVKYSFPSKTLEYMSTGTPVAMCRLSGVPDEYYNYVLTLKHNSLNDFQISLRSILDLPIHELKMVGERAKEFVLHNKNNREQAAKIIRFLVEL